MIWYLFWFEYVWICVILKFFVKDIEFFVVLVLGSRVVYDGVFNWL